MATCPYVHMPIGPYVHMSMYPCPYVHYRHVQGHGQTDIWTWTGKMDKTSKITVRDSSLDSCLGQELPGTILKSRARHWEREDKVGHGPPPGGGLSGSWNPAEIKET
jgi:hypothetical protein